MGIAHNSLAWQKYAGKTVGIDGARFFSINPFPNKTYMMGIVSSPYPSDISECMVARESVPAAANFKLYDAVNIVVKLAPNPVAMVSGKITFNVDPIDPIFFTYSCYPVNVATPNNL